jgi:outer membrane protein TolC
MRLSSIYWRTLLSSTGVAWMIMPCCAQPKALSVREALSLVQTQQPQLQASKERAAAAGYNTNLARNTLVPDLTVGYQAGYATFNNITGMSYPGLFLPISGPPVASNTYDLVPGTALTAMLKWSPLTFGQREAAIDKAAAQYKLANAEYNDAVFRQQYAVLNTYLDLVYLNKLLASLRVNTDRTRNELQQSLTLAKEGLRPGIDTIQFQAALAQSEIDLLGTQRTFEAQAVELSRLLASTGAPEDLTLTDTLFAISTPQFSDTALSVTDNPRYRWYKAKKDVSFSSLREVQRSWRPHLDVWANVYGRGSGILANGTVSKSDGWRLTHDNYGAGFQLSFPILQFSQTNLQKKQYRSFLAADEAQLAQVSLDLSKQMETAHRNYQQNRLIAERIPTVTHAQQLAYQGLQLSYDNGLIDYTRLEQARYNLLQAEIAQAGAYIQAWRSLLDMAVVAGRLSLFTDQVSQP